VGPRILSVRALIRSLQLQRQVSRQVRLQARQAVESIVRGEASQTGLEGHVKNVEGLKKLADAAFPVHPDAVLAALLGLAIVAGVLVLSQWHVGRARISASIDAGRVTLAFREADPPVIEAPVVKVSRVRMQAQDPALRHSGVWALAGDARLSELKVTGQVDLHFSAIETDRLELLMPGATARAAVSAHEGITLTAADGKPVQKPKGEFIDFVSSSGPAMIELAPGLRIQDARRADIRFSVPAVSGHEVKAFASTIAAAHLVLHDAGGQKVELPRLQHLRIDSFDGSIQVTGSEGRLQVTLEGAAGVVDAGPHGYERSLKPSILQSWSKQSELTFLLALAGAIWTVAWTIRKTIFAGGGKS
jgi:hypothetical protein